MKATKKTIGAIALSAALALGTAVPAFAAPSDPVFQPETTGDPAVANPNGNLGTTDEATKGAVEMDEMTYLDKDGNAVTDGKQTKQGTTQSHVYLTSTIPNIDVTVPLYVQINAKMVGGPITGPSAGLKNTVGGLAEGSPANSIQPGITGYRIENRSDIDVTVTEIAEAALNSKWDLTQDATKVGTTAEVADADKNSKIGALMLKLEPSATQAGTTSTATVGGNPTEIVQGKNEGNLAANNVAWLIGGDTTANAGYTGADRWVVSRASTVKSGANDVKVPAIMGLSLTGDSSRLNLLTGSPFNPSELTGDNSDTYFDQVFDIVFTVSA